MAAPWVCIVIGSDSDAEVMSQACTALDELGVAYEKKVSSAHRSPERTHEILSEAEHNGAAVLISAARKGPHPPHVELSSTYKPNTSASPVGFTLSRRDGPPTAVAIP